MKRRGAEKKELKKSPSGKCPDEFSLVIHIYIFYLYPRAGFIGGRHQTDR